MISGVLAPSTNLISHPLSLGARDGGSWLDYPWMPLCTHSRYSYRVSRCGAAADAICSSSQPQRILSMVTMPTPMPFCGTIGLVCLIIRTNTRHIRTIWTNTCHPDGRNACVWNSVGTANFRFGTPNPSGPSFFIGIQSTPTIDRSTYRAYVSYRLGGADDSRAQQWLAAIDVKTGRLIRKTLTGQAPHFELKNERQRASLLLDHGLVFVAFGSRCEELTKLTHLVLGVPIVTRRPYHGWIFAHDANTLNQVGSHNVAPGRMGAGVWQASGGLAADESGRVYFISGNFAADANTPDPTGQNLGNSFVRLDVQITARQGIVERADMRVGSWFTPYRAKWQNDIDLDLGSAGPVLIPRTNYVVGGGKEGVLYLLNRDNLGGFAQAPESALPPKSGDDYSAPFLPNDPRHDRAVDEVQAGVNQYKEPDMNSWPEFPHIHGSPVYADLGNGRQMIYVWAEKDYLKGFDIAGGRFHSQIRGDLIAPTWNGMPGGMLSVSVDPSRPGQGVVFASVPTEQGGIPHGALHAYDAARLGGSIWTSQELYLFARFVPPTVAGSKVYLATWSNEILVFGSLRPGGVGIISCKPPPSDWGHPPPRGVWSRRDRPSRAHWRPWRVPKKCWTCFGSGRTGESASYPGNRGGTRAGASHPGLWPRRDRPSRAHWRPWRVPPKWRTCFGSGRTGESAP